MKSVCSSCDGVYTLSSGSIAVLLATYNGSKYLIELLDSLLHQTYTDFVCFIHDDCSSDGTDQIAEEYCKNHPEQFIYTGSSRIGGAKQNFLWLLAHVEADYIMFCDQDDVWFSKKIEKEYRVMKRAEIQAHGEVGKISALPILVYSDLAVTDENLNVIGQSFYTYTHIYRSNSLNDLLYHNVCAGCTILINRSLRELSLTRLSKKIVDKIHMHDWYLALLARCRGRLIFINEPLIYYRQCSQNVIGAKQKSFHNTIRNIGNPKALKKSWDTNKDNAEAILYVIGYDDPNAKSVRKFIRVQSKPYLIRFMDYCIWRLRMEMNIINRNNKLHIGESIDHVA